MTPINRTRQQGTTMIEVLVTVVIISVGLLGIASLQLLALRNSQGALQDSMATMYSYSMLDSLRANPTAARAEQYDGKLCTPPAGATLVARDQAFWIGALKEQLGDGACGAVDCNSGSCKITVSWKDAGDKVADRDVVTESQL